MFISIHVSTQKTASKEQIERAVHKTTIGRRKEIGLHEYEMGLYRHVGRRLYMCMLLLSSRTRSKIANSSLAAMGTADYAECLSNGQTMETPVDTTT